MGTGGSRWTPWRVGIGAVLLLVVLGLLYQRFATRPPPAPRVVTIYAFSIMQEVLEEALLPAFRERFSRATGERVEFAVTYGGSAWITDEVLRRVGAEIVILSSEIDAYRLVEGGLLGGAIWRHLPSGGIISASPIVLAVREGNPLDLRDFADLARPGVEVLHADPLTSGAGEWSVLAIHATTLPAAGGGVVSRPVALTDLLPNVIGMPSSAREMRREFERGVGDVMITYEIEARATAGAEPVYPARTMLSRHVVCKIREHIDPERGAVIDALLEFLFTQEAQAELTRHGFRPGDVVSDGERPETRWLTLDDLGGARKARREVLDPLWREGIFSGETGRESSERGR
ncbi:MAG TPA: substrate-binding domain-containing protein [Candidatus Polarisedimenticolaceae bacterium]|nr:substrate-binding domain-containing protein [Candidatus Polarisedimenticolaceae bacterium]